MIFCIFGGGKCRPRWGVQRGLPLALLGNFQRYVVLRLGKFPNKLRYFLRKYPVACRPSARLPFGGGCPCRLLTHITPPYFFPFGRWVAGRSFPFSKALLHGAVGYKVFPINLPLASLRAYLSGKPCIRPPRHPPTEREKIRVGLYG